MFYIYYNNSSFFSLKDNLFYSITFTTSYYIIFLSSDNLFLPNALAANPIYDINICVINYLLLPNLINGIYFAY
jgi:hypothetical protein